MEQLLQRFTVQFEYPVVFTRDVFEPENRALTCAMTRLEPGRRHRALVVVDTGVADAWPALRGAISAYFDAHAHRIELAGPPVLLPGGETIKTDRGSVEALLARLHHFGMDRHSFVVAVGGGAMLDMVGYASAIAHRGLRIVRLPTTVLAQADSGVGVKNGVNFFGKKNFIGTFAPPFAVINDARFLETLAPIDARAGMAEAVKVALVRDRSFFEWIAARARPLGSGRPSPVAELVQRSAELHLRHIAAGGDPFELGSSRPLDFGHWAAHKLESLTRYRLRHGEAVAIGIAIDAMYSNLADICSPRAAEAAIGVLEQLGFRLWDPALEDRGRRGRRVVLDGIAEFREHLGGELTITMLREVGVGVDVHAVDEDRMAAALDRLRERDRLRAAS